MDGGRALLCGLYLAGRIDAAVNGHEVFIAEGAYTGDGNRALNFNGRWEEQT